VVASAAVSRRDGFGKKGDCPVTEDVSDRLLRLPFYNNLKETDQEYIVEKICSYLVGERK
jgi:dTDP-4-amino-4,6-dideoxygalactose transaminase